MSGKTILARNLQQTIGTNMKYVNQIISGMAKTWRNKDLDKRMTAQQVEYFANLSIQTPTKQSNKYFEVIAVSDADIINSIWQHTSPPDDDGLVATQMKNSQVYGSMILVWVKRPLVRGRLENEKAGDRDAYAENDLEGNDSLIDGHQAIGISSGVVAYEANRLGYVTGFCRCFNEQEVYPLLYNNLPEGHTLGQDPDEYHAELILSIGYPKFDDRHRHQNIYRWYEEHKKPPAQPWIIK